MTFNSIVVTCSVKNKTVLTTLHYILQPRKVQKKLNYWNESQVKNQLNVIFFGTDSVSRLNFHRHLPKSLHFLRKHLNALEFYGYNKVGDNSFPNLVPILSGFTRNELLNHSCFKEKKLKVFDECPLIWKDFAKSNYITSYLEVKCLNFL